MQLSDIRRDGGTQMRDAISETTAQSYAEHLQDGAEFPPVIVFHDGADYWLADGFHRCKAYDLAGISEVPADVRSGSRIEAVRYALKANATNGRPRTGDDMRRAYDVAVRNELCQATDSESVKELLGCSLRWARSLTQSARTEAKAQRDAEIMRLAEAGKTQREIAEEVGVSTMTVNDTVRKRNSSETVQPPAPADDYDKAIQAEARRIEARRKEEKAAEKQRKIQERNALLEKAYQEKTLLDINALEPNTWYRVGSQFLFTGSNLSNAFKGRLPENIRFAFADPPYNAGVDEWDKDFVWQQDYISGIADIVAVTPGGWNAFGFYQQTKMPYIWEMCAWIANGMTHGRCGYANFIKVSIFGKEKPRISQDHFKITIKTSQTEDTKHKGRKPYDFMLHLIDLFSYKGDNIVDLFAGSGTTLLMSEQTGRTSYNAEIDLDYCKQIIKRAVAEGADYERI